MDGARVQAPSRWAGVDNVWGPGLWGRTDLSPKSWEDHRQAWWDPTGLGKAD
jgi:hypothetical protein